MDDLERLVTLTLHDRERAAPSAHDLLDGVRRRERLDRAQRTRWAVSGAAAAVVALVATGAVIRSTANVPAPSASRTPGALSAPAAGMQWVGYRGVFVQIPADWPLNRRQCGTPMENTAVTVRGFVCAMLVSRPVGVTDVAFSHRTVHDPTDVEATTVDGWRAEVGTRPVEVYSTGAEKLVETTLRLLDRPVVVTVTSADTKLARSIVDSVRVVDIDPTGCALQPRSTLAPRPTRSGGAEELVPGQPTSSVLCRYEGGWLEVAEQRGAAATARLAAGLNELRHGFNESAAEAGGMVDERCPEANASFVVATFFYPAGPPLTVYIRPGTCEQRGASNGARASRLSAALLASEFRGVTGVYTAVGLDGVDESKLDGYPFKKR